VESVNGLDAIPDCSTRSSHPPTGVLFYEPTTESIIGAVERLEQNMRFFDREKIRAHAVKFSRATFKNRIAQFIAEKTEQRTR